MLRQKICKYTFLVSAQVFLFFICSFYNLRHACVCNVQVVVKIAPLCMLFGHISNSIFRLKSYSDEGHCHEDNDKKDFTLKCLHSKAGLKQYDILYVWLNGSQSLFLFMFIQQFVISILKIKLNMTQHDITFFLAWLTQHFFFFQ